MGGQVGRWVGSSAGRLVPRRLCDCFQGKNHYGNIPDCKRPHSGYYYTHLKEPPHKIVGPFWMGSPRCVCGGGVSPKPFFSIFLAGPNLTKNIWEESPRRKESFGRVFAMWGVGEEGGGGLCYAHFGE